MLGDSGKFPNSSLGSRQPAMESLLERLSEEISARAVLLLHENGQVIHRHGWIEEREFPAMAALVAAMIATGKSLGSLGENLSGSPTRFGCDSDEVGLYTVTVRQEIWLAALYDQPLNPGQLRMKVRRYATTMARLEEEAPGMGESPSPQGAVSWAPARSATGAKLPPAPVPGPVFPEKITQSNTGLFSNITDDEIDRLFENAES